MLVKNSQGRALLLLALLFLLVGLAAAAVYCRQGGAPGFSQGREGRAGYEVERAREDPAAPPVETAAGRATGGEVYAPSPDQRGAREPLSGRPDQGGGEGAGELPAGEGKAQAGTAPSVGVAVVGKNGELLFGPAEVRLDPGGRWGCTALGALAATGLPYQLAPGWNAFVESVAGQRNRGSSGWMYQVNGEVPMVGADKKKVGEGDKIIWWYSRSIDQPPPVWENLVNKV